MIYHPPPPPDLSMLFAVRTVLVQTYIQAVLASTVAASRVFGSIMRSNSPRPGIDRFGQVLNISPFYIPRFDPDRLSCQCIAHLQGFSSATLDRYFSRSKFGSEASRITITGQQSLPKDCGLSSMSVMHVYTISCPSALRRAMCDAVSYNTRKDIPLSAAGGEIFFFHSAFACSINCCLCS